MVLAPCSEMRREHRISLVELCDAAGPFSEAEAAAVIAALCRVAPEPDAIGATKRPLRAADVSVDRDGRFHLAPGVTPSVAELGQLLERLLADIRESGSGRLSPGLVLVAARATGRIDLAPFPSRESLAAALARFGTADSGAVARALYEKGADVRSSARVAASPGPLVIAAADRRIHDELEYQTPLVNPAGASSGPSGPGVSPRRYFQWSLAAAAAVALIAGFSAGLLFEPGPVRPQVSDVTEVTVEPPPPATPRPQPSAPRNARSGRPAEGAAHVARAAEPTGDRNGPRPLVDPDPAGSEKVFSPSFAPTGTAVFFHAETESGTALKRADASQAGYLHVVTILDDNAKNYHVQVAPDGKTLAFDSDRDGVRGVYVAAVDGSNVRRVSGDGYAAVPTWSPDGRRLAFLRAENDRPNVWNLWLLDLASGDTMRLTRHRFGQVWGGAWFPDGRRLAYSHEDRLILLDLETGRTRTHDSPIKGRLVRTPAVSPDGRWIIFQVFRDGAWLLNVQTGAVRRVLGDPSAEEFTWDPSGNRVAFHSRNRGGWGLWVMSAPAS